MHFPSFCGQHAAVTAIDSHDDAFPDALADKAVSSIADQAVVKPAINGRITTLLGSMGAAKVWYEGLSVHRRHLLKVPPPPGILRGQDPPLRAILLPWAWNLEALHPHPLACTGYLVRPKHLGRPCSS